MKRGKTTKTTKKTQLRTVALKKQQPRTLLIRESQPEPGDEVVVQETTRLVTEPEVEVRRAGTLAQALTEPAVAVVKPRTRVAKVQKKVTRRAA